MFKFIVLAVLFIGAQSRYILVEDDIPVYYIEEPHDVQFQPRIRREAQTAVTVDGNGNTQIQGKVPLYENDKHLISAAGGISPNAKSVGLAYEHANGHGLSLSHTSNPNLGDQVKAAGNLNLVSTPDHKLDANAFVTRNMPAASESFNTYGGGLDYMHKNGHELSLSHTSNQRLGDQLTAAGKLNLVNTPVHKFDANAFVTRNMPKASDHFNTFGGGLDYMYKGKVGGSLDVARDNFHQMTDVSAMGKLNLFKSDTSSLDLGTGVSRSFTPHFQSSWQPNFLLKWTKSW